MGNRIFFYAFQEAPSRHKAVDALYPTVYVLLAIFYVSNDPHFFLHFFFVFLNYTGR